MMGVKMQRNVRRSILLAVCIIVFIFFEIHSCSRDRVTEPSVPPVESIICSATNVFFLDGSFGCVTGAVGTIMITRDGGVTWTGSKIEEGTLTGAQFIDAETGWVVGKDGAIFKTTDGGMNWTKIVSSGYPYDEDFYKINFRNGALGYLLGYHGVYCTVDGGSDWCNNWLALVPYRGAWDMSIVNDTVGYLLGSKYSDPDPIIIYRTVDGGMTWSPVSGSSGSLLRTITTISFVSRDVGWAGGGVIMKTDDGGMVWENQVASATVRRMSFVDEMCGFAVGGAAILRTTDGGTTWENVTPVDSRISDLRGVCFISRDLGWVVGRASDQSVNGTLYKRSILLRTRDGGATWKLSEFPFDYTGYDDVVGPVD